MPRVKQASGRKRVIKAAVPALGAAGLTFAGAASASTMPNVDVPDALNFAPNQTFALGEEEIADVSLATFHLFDKENANGSAAQQVAYRGCRCGGCRSCGCRGCRSCRCGGCYACGGCCASWGYCRFC